MITEELCRYLDELLALWRLQLLDAEVKVGAFDAEVKVGAFVHAVNSLKEGWS